MPVRMKFTLIELLVVIGIIALLCSMLLPALSSAKDKARQLACNSNMRQVAMALNSYADENSDYLPPCVTDLTNYDDFWDKTRVWRMVYKTPDNARHDFKAWRKSVFACPSSAKDAVGSGGWYSASSYAMNTWYPTGSQDNTNPRKRSFAISPSRTLLIGEGSNHYITGWFYVAVNNGYGPPAFFPHQSRMNMSFMDIHAEARTVPQVPTASSDIFWKGR